MGKWTLPVAQPGLLAAARRQSSMTFSAGRRLEKSLTVRRRCSMSANELARASMGSIEFSMYENLFI